MPSKIQPEAYDADTGTVSLHDGRCRGWYFVERAVYEYLAYGDPQLLAWAVEQQMPEVLQDDVARELMTRLIEGKPVRKRGGGTKSREADRERDQILATVWFYIGQGYPAFISDESAASGHDACGLAAAEHAISKSKAYRLWQKAGGRHPQGGTYLAAQFHINRGKRSVTTK